MRHAEAEIERRIQDESGPGKESSRLGRCARRGREGGRECMSKGGGAGLGGRAQPVCHMERGSPARGVLGDWPAPRGWEFKIQDGPMKEAQM